MSAGGDPCGEKREDLETGRGEMRGVWNLRGSMSEEGDRAERVKKREEFPICGVLPSF